MIPFFFGESIFLCGYNQYLANAKVLELAQQLMDMDAIDSKRYSREYRNYEYD